MAMTMIDDDDDMIWMEAVRGLHVRLFELLGIEDGWGKEYRFVCICDTTCLQVGKLFSLKYIVDDMQ
jgi:hypothetical protein